MNPQERLAEHVTETRAWFVEQQTISRELYAKANEDEEFYTKADEHQGDFEFEAIERLEDLLSHLQDAGL